MRYGLKSFGIVLICTVITFTLHVGYSYAQSSDSQPQPELDVSIALYDFLSLAFTEKIWNEENPPKIFTRQLKSYLFQDKIGGGSILKADEWAAPYLDTNRQLPDNGTIHKWDVDVITVGLGRPFDKNYVENEGLQKSYSLIIDRFNKLRPILERQTGKRIQLIKPENERDNYTGYGHIRIIPMEVIGAITGYPGFSGPPQLFYEQYFFGAELFESSNPELLRGFLIPDSNNSLAFSICKVRMDVDTARFNQSVDECLVRSMGLPGSFVDNQKKESSFVQEEYLKMLPILYCRDIKSGMSKNKVLRTFAFDFQCRL